MLNVAAATATFAQDTPKELVYTIRGKFEGLGNGKVIWYYIDKNLPQGVFTDSTQAKDDTFEIRGKLTSDVATFFRLGVRQEGNLRPKVQLPAKGYELFLSAGDVITLEGVVKNGDIVSVNAKGNQHVLDWDELRTKIAPIESSIDPIMAEFRALRAANANVGHLQPQLDSLRNILKQKLLDFIRDHPSSLISVYELNSVSSILPLDTLVYYYNRLDEKLQLETTYGRDIARSIEARKKTRPGTLVQDFARSDTAGKTIRLSDYRGRYVILDFWASWCSPCRKSHPHMIELYNKYKTAGVAFEVLAIATNDKKNAWKKAIQDDNLPWINVIDEEKELSKKLANLLAIQALPTKVFLDPQGKIIAVITGDEKAVESKMIELFKK
jgi:thiol-disulfide isomerase/thioredoxin